MMVEIKNSGEKIAISNIDKVGIVHIQGVEKYLKRNNPKYYFIVTPLKPHDNVLKMAEDIRLLKIVISSNFSEEKKKIEQEYSNMKIVTVDPYELAGRDGMLDGD